MGWSASRALSMGFITSEKRWNRKRRWNRYCGSGMGIRDRTGMEGNCRRIFSCGSIWNDFVDIGKEESRDGICSVFIGQLYYGRMEYLVYIMKKREIEKDENGN